MEKKLLGKISKNEDEIEDFLEKERNFYTKIKMVMKERDDLKTKCD